MLFLFFCESCLIVCSDAHCVQVAVWWCMLKVPVFEILVFCVYLLRVFIINLLRVFFIDLLHHKIFSIWLLYQGSLAPVHRWGFSTSAVTGPQQGDLHSRPESQLKNALKICPTEPGRGKILLSTINAFTFSVNNLIIKFELMFGSLYFEIVICSGHRENKQCNNDTDRPLWGKE